jgi:hypothetical protein
MTFFTLDEDEIPPDELEVLRVSSILQITEFHLFELAYHRWFGKNANEAHIEKHFTAYMFGRMVPPWVRQFCRDVLRRDRDGTLNPTEFGVFPREESLSQYQRGINYILVIVIIVLTLHLVAVLVATS